MHRLTYPGSVSKEARPTDNQGEVEGQEEQLEEVSESRQIAELGLVEQHDAHFLLDVVDKEQQKHHLADKPELQDTRNTQYTRAKGGCLEIQKRDHVS